MGTAWSQSFPPPPTFTSKSVRNLSGKVFIVTGSSSGIGFELAKILYEHHSSVYIAARSFNKAKAAIESIKAAWPDSKGKIPYLHLDLADLKGIKASVEEFLGSEERLDVLWNNAGVLTPPVGAVTTQGYELQMGTSCLGPFLFTQMLLPLLKRTAASASSVPGSIRVTWTGSLAIQLGTPPGGLDLDDLDCKKGRSQMYYYAQSKCGNLFLGSELARKTTGEGIISMNSVPAWERFLVRLLAYKPIFGAYTELFAGLSPDITMAESGGYVVPWGRLAPIKPDIVPELTEFADGTVGKAQKFWEYCEAETERYI